jgi:hypothetical protein
VASGSILCYVNKKVEFLIKSDLGLRPSTRNAAELQSFAYCIGCPVPVIHSCKCIVVCKATTMVQQQRSGVFCVVHAKGL